MGMLRRADRALLPGSDQRLMRADADASRSRYPPQPGRLALRPSPAILQCRREHHRPRRRGCGVAGGPTLRSVPHSRRNSRPTTAIGKPSTSSSIRPDPSARLDAQPSIRDHLSHDRPLLFRRHADCARCRRAVCWRSRPAAQAQLSFRVGPGGQFQPMPIAIADFAGEGDLGQRVSGIIANNLQRSGYFTPLDKSRFPERPSFDAAPRFEAWRAAGAQALVTGRVTRDPSGRLKAEFRLWDVDLGPADHRPAILHRPEFLAPHRPHHLGRGLHQDHRLRRLLRHPHRVRRRVRLRRRTAASGSPSWTRTAPMCAS